MPKSVERWPLPARPVPRQTAFVLRTYRVCCYCDILKSLDLSLETLCASRRCFVHKGCLNVVVSGILRSRLPVIWLGVWGPARNIAPVPAFNALPLPLFRRVQITLMSGKDTEFICDFAATFISNKRGCHPFWV